MHILKMILRRYPSLTMLEIHDLNWIEGANREREISMMQKFQAILRDCRRLHTIRVTRVSSGYFEHLARLFFSSDSLMEIELEGTDLKYDFDLDLPALVKELVDKIRSKRIKFYVVCFYHGIDLDDPSAYQKIQSILVNPNLTDATYSCELLEDLPGPIDVLSQLPFLERLIIFNGELHATITETAPFQGYPSLKQLTIDNVVTENDILSHHLYLLPGLEDLSILNCTIDGEYLINVPLHRFKSVTVEACHRGPRKIGKGTATVAKLSVHQRTQSSERASPTRLFSFGIQPSSLYLMLAGLYIHLTTGSSLKRRSLI